MRGPAQSDTRLTSVSITYELKSKRSNSALQKDMPSCFSAEGGVKSEDAATGRAGEAGTKGPSLRRQVGGNAADLQGCQFLQLSFCSRVAIKCTP